MNPLHLALRLHEGVTSRCRNLWFRALGVRIDGYVWMRRISIPRQWGKVVLASGTALDEGVVLLATGKLSPEPKIAIHSGTYINRFTMIDASARITIGQNCMIGPHCYVTDHDHAHESGKLVREQELASKPVTIGNDVWLGAGVIVLKGVTIGEGAVVGAGSVVTKDVEPHTKVVGVPARAIGVRN